MPSQELENARLSQNFNPTATSVFSTEAKRHNVNISVAKLLFPEILWTLKCWIKMAVELDRQDSAAHFFFPNSLKNLCARSSSCMEGVWLDGKLDGRVKMDNDYGGLEVRTIVSVIKVIIVIVPTSTIITSFWCSSERPPQSEIFQVVHFKQGVRHGYCLDLGPYVHFSNQGDKPENLKRCWKQNARKPFHGETIHPIITQVQPL